MLAIYTETTPLGQGTAPITAAGTLPKSRFNRKILMPFRTGTNPLSAPPVIRLHFGKGFVRPIERKSRKTFHRAPMGTERKDLAAARSVPDDASDDLISLYPLEPPDMFVHVIYTKLDGSHVAAVETNYAQVLHVAKASPD